MLVGLWSDLIHSSLSTGALQGFFRSSTTEKNGLQPVRQQIAVQAVLAQFFDSSKGVFPKPFKYKSRGFIWRPLSCTKPAAKARCISQISCSVLSMACLSQALVALNGHRPSWHRVTASSSYEMCACPHIPAGYSLQTTSSSPPRVYGREQGVGISWKLHPKTNSSHCWHCVPDCQRSLAESVRRAMLICFWTTVSKSIKLATEKSNSWQVFTLHILQVSLHSPQGAKEWFSHVPILCWPRAGCRKEGATLSGVCHPLGSPRAVLSGPYLLPATSRLLSLAMELSWPYWEAPQTCSISTWWAARIWKVREWPKSH